MTHDDVTRIVQELNQIARSLACLAWAIGVAGAWIAIAIAVGNRSKQ